MSNQSISIRLNPDNLLWLKSKALTSKAESLSDALNTVLNRVRSDPRKTEGSEMLFEAKARISEADPDLREADAAIRELFRGSLERTVETLRSSPRESS